MRAEGAAEAGYEAGYETCGKGTYMSSRVRERSPCEWAPPTAVEARPCVVVDLWDAASRAPVMLIRALSLRLGPGDGRLGPPPRRVSVSLHNFFKGDPRALPPEHRYSPNVFFTFFDSFFDAFFITFIRSLSFFIIFPFLLGFCVQ